LQQSLKLDRKTLINLNKKEALAAVVSYLQTYNSRTKPDETETLIKALSVPNLNKSANMIAIQKDWEDILYQLHKKNMDGIYTEKEIFDAMITLLEKYYERTNSDDIGGLLSDLGYIDYGATADPAAWYDWQDSLTKVKGN
jgi:hypothetical protein